ncbi:hypothetical protein SAMN04488577_3874 [Bacillus sp. cl95]|nr:hypothetical protein [Bacillus sp. UNCCL13]SFB20044.1 hypothetical protein SAMN02799634_10858 [Bacillus sp. UNCCL13]SFQ90806.1 hypothetical protein SAMN04488577_3874 [Bacillus sp. cl95]
MKISELMERLKTLDQNSELKISLLKDGYRPFCDMKDIGEIDPVFDQDTGKLTYTISVSVNREEIDFIKEGLK